MWVSAGVAWRWLVLTRILEFDIHVFCLCEFKPFVITIIITISTISADSSHVKYAYSAKGLAVIIQPLKHSLDRQRPLPIR